MGVDYYGKATRARTRNMIDGFYNFVLLDKEAATGEKRYFGIFSFMGEITIAFSLSGSPPLEVEIWPGCVHLKHKQLVFRRKICVHCIGNIPIQY